MTDEKWFKEWPLLSVTRLASPIQSLTSFEHIARNQIENDCIKAGVDPVFIGVDCGMSDRTVAHKIYMNGDKLVVSEVSYDEMYHTMPQGFTPKPEWLANIPDIKQAKQLTFECNTCGAIHDPCTTSFTLLVNSAKELGWRIKWLDLGYTVTCQSCLANALSS